MNRLSLLSTFAAVASARNFTRAAERLGLSKSVVSRHVSELERELGVQLVYRSTHGVSLTEAGERCFSHCKDLEQVAEQAVAAATAAQERPTGLLRVTLPQTLVVSPVGELITRFQSRHPAVQLDVRVTSLQVDPVEEGFDLALWIGNLKDSNLVCRKLRDVRFLAVAAPAYLRRHGCPRTLEDLRNHNCLTYSEFAARSGASIQTVSVRRSAVGLTGNLGTNSGVLLLNALLAGQGIVIGPDLMFETHLKDGRLRVVLDGQAVMAAGLYAVFPPGRFPSASRRIFVDFLVSELTPSPARATA
jgi:DNA-binding transcriptional LysR family regulator